MFLFKNFFCEKKRQLKTQNKINSFLIISDLFYHELDSYIYLSKLYYLFLPILFLIKQL